MDNDKQIHESVKKIISAKCDGLIKMILKLKNEIEHLDDNAESRLRILMIQVIHDFIEHGLPNAVNHMIGCEVLKVETNIRVKQIH